MKSVTSPGALFTIAMVTAACAAPSHNQPPQQTEFAQAVAPPQRLAPGATLPAVARENLRARMAFHARDMNALVSDIMLLRYDEISDRAQRIASDASLSRPLTNDATELNSFFPEKFFLYQDNVRLEAKTLAEAAGRQSAFDVADSYGRLSQVCVRCHAAYRGVR